MRRISFNILALTLLFLAACRKEEFQQVPHGEPVPHADTAKYDLPTLLGMSQYKLFNTAWQKGHMNELLERSVRYTILAPDDAAMQAAGLDAAGIAALSPEQLDSLLRYHVVNEQLDTLALRMQKGNVRKKSLLYHPSLMENLNSLGSNVTYPTPYNYKHFIGMANGSLLVNGKDAGNAQPSYATNGIIWPVKMVLQRPSESIMDVLQRDARFSMLTQLLHQTDSIWLEASMGFFERNYFAKLAPRQDNNLVVSEAFFAPTNEAFHNAGFNSVEDLMTLNARSMPYFDWDIFVMVNGFVTDTLLNYHIWGRMYAPYGPWGKGAESAAIFYSNELNNNMLSNFALNVGDDFLPPYIMPLDFAAAANGKVSLRQKGSSHPPAVVTEANINTFQGPMHVVDHLLIPENLNINF
jgi:uncharacterized surface protein with fasciclin (FAS1) repeats